MGVLQDLVTTNAWCMLWMKIVRYGICIFYAGDGFSLRWRWSLGSCHGLYRDLGWRILSLDVCSGLWGKDFSFHPFNRCF
jgi:hypothetical protein